MKINCNVCIRNHSTTTALTLAVGIFLLTSAAAAADNLIEKPTPT